jgi:hypothetical protein
MPPDPRPAASRTGARPLVVILLLTLGLAGFLTYEAWDAARRHRSSAEQTLREYAAFAAWEFNASLKENLYSTVVWLFGPVRTSEPLWPGEKLAPPSILAASLRPDLRCDAAKEPTTFRVDFADRRIVLDGPPFPGGFSSGSATPSSPRSTPAATGASRITRRSSASSGASGGTSCTR